MKLAQSIFSNLKESFLCYTPNRSFYESMMKFDFKIENEKNAMMQLCFSAFAAWPLYVGLLLIYLDPTKYSWTLHKYMADDNQFGLFLLDGRFSAMAIVFAVFFFLEWIFRKEYLFEFIIFYFLLKTDIHLHLALSMLLAVYLSRFCYLWWFYIGLENTAGQIWRKACSRLLMAWVVVAAISLYGLDYLQFNRYFTSSVSENRFEFLVFILFLLHSTMSLFLMIWGHFFTRRKVEPSHMPIYFSTTIWILRFNMSYYLKKLLKEATALQIEKNKSHAAQIVQIKDQSPVIQLENIQSILKKEMAYLKEASSKLTID